MIQTNKIMVYEQPLNEQIRLALRLEYLFEQIDQCLNRESSWDLRHALNTILELLYITDRPYLKNKLGQLLNQFTTSLTQLEKTPDIDKQKLHQILKQIDQLIDDLRSDTQKIGNELRENEFLTSIQQRLYTPAGTCSFCLPTYHLWLQQDKNLLKKQIYLWLDSFKLLRAITNLILKLIRESTSFKKIKIDDGFYQSSLETNIPCQMIRIRISLKKMLFPEISVGNHRLAVYFFTIDINGNTTQILDNLEFELACCKL